MDLMLGRVISSQFGGLETIFSDSGLLQEPAPNTLKLYNELDERRICNESKFRDYTGY